jgi:PST family polysaccharide transporter
MKGTPDDTPPASLTQRTVRGVAWTLPTSLGSRVIGLVGTLLLARFLAPAEFGEVSAAAIVTVTAFSLTTFGVGIYLVSHRELTRAEAFHATIWFLATGIAAMAGVWALSGPLGRWVEAPNLDRFMPVFVGSVLLDRVTFLPERMLIRKLRFRWLSLARAAGELTYTGVSLTLAVLGVGAMAIAWGNLARSVLRFVAIVPAVQWREWLEPHRLRLATMFKIVAYGVNVSVASIATFAMRRWDNLLVSRYFGPAAMGAYNYAYNLADTPAVAIGEPMSDVVGASFPHADPHRRAAALVQSCTMVSLIMFPLAFGLGAVAETVVQAFFNQKWAGVGTMLVYLSVLSAPRPMAHILHSYFFSCQRPRVVLYLEWAALTAIIVSIATIGRLGIDWTCGAVGSVFVLRTLAAFWTAQYLDKIPMRSFLVPLLRPLLACVAMVAAILAARPALLGLSPAIRLVAEVGVGAVVYGIGALLIFRPAAREFFGLLRTALVRR